MDVRMSSSSALEALSRPSIAFLVTLTAINRIPMIMGKLRMAITMLPLLVLEAMAERIVRVAEKPNEERTRTKKKSAVSWIGFVNHKEKNKYPAQQIPVHSRNP